MSFLSSLPTIHALNSQWFQAPSLGLAGRQTCQGCSWGSCTSFPWKTSRVALGAFWPVVGEMAVAILSSTEPHCPLCPWPAFLVFVPLSPDGKAGHSAQCLTHPWSLSCFLIHGPGLNCLTFISSCSPISLSVYKLYFYAAWADLDMKLAWLPAVWEYFCSFFFLLSEIIYCCWKIWY